VLPYTSGSNEEMVNFHLNSSYLDQRSSRIKHRSQEPNWMLRFSMQTLVKQRG